MPEIEVVYALPNASFSRIFTVNEGCTVLDAIKQSGVLDHHPEIKLDDISSGKSSVGIYGEIVSPQTPVQDGARIEIYRALKHTPEDLRRRREKDNTQS